MTRSWLADFVLLTRLHHSGLLAYQRALRRLSYDGLEQPHHHQLLAAVAVAIGRDHEPTGGQPCLR